jgi:hypothetical protein
VGKYKKRIKGGIMNQNKISYGINDMCQYIQCMMAQKGYGRININEIKDILDCEREQIVNILYDGDIYMMSPIGCITTNIKEASEGRPSWDLYRNQPVPPIPNKAYNKPKFTFYKKFKETMRDKTWDNPVRESKGLERIKEWQEN